MIPRLWFRVVVGVMRPAQSSAMGSPLVLRYNCEAIAYPNTVESRVLQESTGHLLQRYANAGGTLANTGVTIYIVTSGGSGTTATGSSSQPFAN